MSTARRPRMGRPPEFAERVRLQVFVERRELVALQRLAAAAGASASGMVRRLVLDFIQANRKGTHHAR